MQEANNYCEFTIPLEIFQELILRMSDLEALVKNRLMFVINLRVFFLFKIYCKHLENCYINNNDLMYILN